MKAFIKSKAQTNEIRLRITSSISLAKYFNLLSVFYLCFWCSNLTDHLDKGIIEIAVLVGVLWYGITLRIIGSDHDIIIGGK